MNLYKMIIYAVESGDGFDYVAEYPALKGVVGVGANETEAMLKLRENAEINIQALKEAGLPIPESDLVEKAHYSGKLSVRLSSGLHRRIAQLSIEEGVSINQCIVEAVSMYVAEKNSEHWIDEKITQRKNHA
ncbi:MAG: type II toxin-antitoxin system HicB family antitoxin [Erysipelotrichaceae bacterium]